MAEYHDPPLRLTIQGLRWDGEEWSDKFSREPAPFQMFGTDGEEDPTTVLRALRRMAVTRLDMILFLLAESRAALDFDAPNWPTEADLSRLVEQSERITSAVRVLRELAPEVLPDDDDGDDEPAPEPEPEPSEADS